MTNRDSASASSKSWTSLKLDLLQCLSADPRVGHRDFRIAERILRQVSEDKGTAYISDATICDEVTKVDRFALNDFRKLMVSIGWIEVLPRKRRKHATTYRFLTKNINPLLDVILVKREARKAAREDGQITPRKRKVDVVNAPRQKKVDVVNAPRPDVVNAPPLHLRGSPGSLLSTDTETYQGGATRVCAYTHARGDGPDPVLIEAYGLIGHGDQLTGKLVAAEMPRQFIMLTDRIRASGGAVQDWQALIDAAEGLARGDMAIDVPDAAE